jgi:hypothetical protein
MTFDVLSRVVANGIIPAVFTVAGLLLAVATLPDRKQRLWYQVSVPVMALLGICAIYLVESRADLAHTKEIADSKQMIEHLQSDLNATRIDAGKQLDALHGDIVAMIKAQPDIAKDVAKQVSAATLALIKTQPSSPLSASTSDAQLKSNALVFASELRTFAKGYQHRLGWTADSNKVTADSTLATADSGPTFLTDDSGHVLTTDSGEPLTVDRQTDAKSRLLQDLRDQFNAKYRESAVRLRDQLISRLGGVAPELAKLPSYRLIAFDGSLTGPESVIYAADYLEALAKKLPEASPH